MSEENIYWITGGGGLLGTALKEVLTEANLAFVAPTSAELDLRDSAAVRDFVDEARPSTLIHLASKVYGIQGNMEMQLEVLSYNTQINDIVFTAISNSAVRKIFFAGTVACYAFPYVDLPLREEMLLSGEPHAGEYGYAASKIHALRYLNVLKRNFGIEYIWGALTNLYGPRDNFRDDSGHVVPSLIRRARSSKVDGIPLQVWGKPCTTRDFLFARDAARAILCLVKASSGVYNISSGIETSLEDLASNIATLYELSEPIVWRSDKPVGIPKRHVDNSKLLATGWKAETSLREGLSQTVGWYQASL
jgi:GDP-L-fucose synthase